MPTLHRATSDGYAGQWSCWSCDRETAEAYRDNPGYGGQQIIETETGDARVLDLRGNRNPVAELCEAIEADFAEEVERYGDLDSYIRSFGYAYVYEIWENNDRVRAALADRYDWVVHDQETFPERATTWVRVAA